MRDYRDCVSLGRAKGRMQTPGAGGTRYRSFCGGWEGGLVFHSGLTSPALHQGIDSPIFLGVSCNMGFLHVAMTIVSWGFYHEGFTGPLEEFGDC